MSNSQHLEQKTVDNNAIQISTIKISLLKNCFAKMGINFFKSDINN